MDRMNRSALCTAASVCLVAAVAAAEGPAGPEKPAVAIRFETVAPPTGRAAGPAAVVLGTASFQQHVARDLKGMLLARGCTFAAEAWRDKEIGPADLAPQVVGAFGKTRRLLLLAGTKDGALAVEILERYPDRLAGAVLISLSPVRQDSDTFRLWRPGEGSWRVPMWVAVGTRPKDAGPVLKMWRQMAADQPAGVSLTIDARIGAALGYVRPGREIGAWLKDVAASRAPKAGRDSQAENERGVYEKLAARLRKAFASAAPAALGETFTKREPPMALSAAPPRGWLRDPLGERAYDPVLNPYVQLYLTASRKGPFFARLCAAKWAGKAPALLDDYDRRLARAGYLTIRYARWEAGGTAYQISSALWPSRDRWHRWLILAAAGKGTKAGPAAPLVMVMDASAKPDLRKMAEVAAALTASISARWIGGRAETRERPPATSPALPGEPIELGP
jgi:hypothetical protein